MPGGRAFLREARRLSTAIAQLITGPTVQVERFSVIASVLCYLILAVTLADVRTPQSDEGHFAEAAFNIATTGRFVMPTWTPWLPTLDHRVYAVMPLYFFALAGWFRIFGMSMLTMRYFTVLWGCIFVLSYYVLMRNISSDRVLALVGMLSLVFNYDLINLTTARYDAMSAGLGALGLAIYSFLRRRNLALALLLSNTCVAAAAMTHPYGALGLAYLAIFFLIFDRDRFRARYFVLAALPYFVALGGWAWYIAQDPTMFRSQFGQNASVHRVSLLHPLTAITSEIRDRYWAYFGGTGTGVSPYMHLKLGVLLLYLVAFVASLLTPEIRQKKHNQLVLACAVFGFLALTFADASRLYIYLVHVIGFYSLLIGVWIRSLIAIGGWKRIGAIAVLTALGLFTVATVGYRAQQNSYKNAFLPAADYLHQRLTGQQLVYATGEFGVPLGFIKHVLDDRSLGVQSHRRADYVVIDREFASTLRTMREKNPTMYVKVMQNLQPYQLVFETREGADFYRVYARPDLNSGQNYVDSAR